MSAARRHPADAGQVAEHHQLDRVEDEDEHRLGDAGDDERGPQDPERALHGLSLQRSPTTRQVCAGSSREMRQCPAGSGGKSAA